ncbi:MULTISPECIES: DUF2511 domain-containing protein [unclassified Pseudomonas]|uniref:DUF2511 domain-containing protein n=1 Tax=unclassified Pseudomonas TaxID=196821 RepID=UPI000A1DE107|nr:MULTISPECIES: DUF2511 domain-containing protein [unclassified Pseudomonas]
MRACLMLSAALVLAGCGGEHVVTVGQAEYGEKWPFTVATVELVCQDGPPSALAKVEGQLYALNGSARSRAAQNGWLDGRDITKPDPAMPTVKMDYSEISTRALKLCSSYAG